MFFIAIYIPGVFLTAYISYSIFHKRVDDTILNFTQIEQFSSSSLGHRIIFAKNSWELIKNNPILGVGTGDFPDEYKKALKEADDGISDFPPEQSVSPSMIWGYIQNDDQFFKSVENWFKENYPGNKLK